jgi:glycosyltransferase involved in cell wall biosynthesis
VEATGQLLTELCEDLAPNHRVEVLAGQPSQAPHQEAFRRVGRQSRQGVTIRRVWHTRFAKRNMLGRLINLLTYLIGATGSALFGPRPDVVVVETDPPFLCGLGLLLRWLRGSKLVIYLQDIHPQIAVAVGKLPEGWLSRSLERCFVFAYRRADAVVVLSRDMERTLLGLGVSRSRLVRVPNWVDCGRVRPGAEQNEFRAKHGLVGKFVVMYSGNMGLTQRLEDLLVVAERLKSDRPDVVFVFIGDGASRARLEALARRLRLANVRFLDYQPKSQLSQSLGAADVHAVFLDPRLKGLMMPSKLYGILAVGKPSLVISDADSELAEVVRDSGAGLCAPHGDVERLRDAIVWCHDHPAELQAMGANGRRLAESDYDRGVSTQRFSQVLQQSLSGEMDALAAAECVATAV